MPALSCHMEEGLVNFALFQKCAKLQIILSKLDLVLAFCSADVLLCLFVVICLRSYTCLSTGQHICVTSSLIDKLNQYQESAELIKAVKPSQSIPYISYCTTSETYIMSAESTISDNTSRNHYFTLPIFSSLLFYSSPQIIECVFVQGP